jgi:putative ABC transport system permease protein
VRSLRIAARAVARTVRFPLRSGLVLGSALLGILGLTVSRNYASSGRERVLGQIRRMGTNVLMVSPTQSRNVGGRARTGTIVTTLKQGDFDALRSGLPYFSRASRLAFLGLLVKAGDLAKNNTIILGCDPDYPEIRNWGLAEGSFFGPGDVRRQARVMVLGAGIARELFPLGSPVGSRATINRVPFLVVGVLAERGQGLDVRNEDDEVLVPVTTALHRLANLDFLGGLAFQVERYAEMGEASRLVSETLRERHRRKADPGDDFTVDSQHRLIETERTSSSRLLFLVLLAGAGALVLAGMGSLGVLWMSVRDRTRQIGTCRALGATQGDVFLELLVEGLVLSLLGAVLGLPLSHLLSRAVAARAGLPFVFDLPVAVLGFLGSLALNAAFTLLPARKAAGVPPLAALRYE